MGLTVVLLPWGKTRPRSASGSAYTGLLADQWELPVADVVRGSDHRRLGHDSCLLPVLSYITFGKLCLAYVDPNKEVGKNYKMFCIHYFCALFAMHC